MNRIPVEGHSELERDSKSSAIINKDSTGYLEYINNRNRMINEKERIQSLENKVENLSSDISYIKTMINLLLKKDE